jgi:CheY-like chemotaxis protein
VLIVDDSSEMRELLQADLETSGYSVASAKNGKEALELLAGHARVPDVIVLDLNMPVMNGWELLTILRSHARLARIPVVIVSAYEPEELRGARLTACLKKPIDETALAQAVGRFVPAS